MTGCDTTSRRYGVGKATGLKKFENIRCFSEQANTFSCHSAVSDVVASGEKALVALFGGKPGRVWSWLCLVWTVLWETCNKDTCYTATESPPNCSSGPIPQPACLSTSKTVAGEGCRNVDRGVGMESNWRSIGSCCDVPAACARLPSTINLMQLFVWLPHYEWGACAVRMVCIVL